MSEDLAVVETAPPERGAQRACASCGFAMRAFPKNRKLCHACQVVRDYRFRHTWSCNCGDCGRKFYPQRTSYKYCYDCTVFPAVRSEYPECSRCGQRKRTAPLTRNVCTACVQSTPEMQASYAKAAMKVAAANRAKYHTPTPEVSHASPQF